MTKYNIPESIIRSARERGEQLSYLMNNPIPDEIRTGQIWSTFQNLDLDGEEFYTDNPKIIVIVDTQPEEDSLFAAAPISTATQYASEYDLLISADKSALGFSFMIEVWNETPVYQKHLKQFLGTLAELETTVLTQIYSLQLFNDPIPTSLSRWVGLKIFGDDDPRLAFQEEELAAISYLAEAATLSVSLLISEAAEDMVSSVMSDFVAKVKPIFASLSNFAPLTKRKLAYAATEHENETFILAFPEDGENLIFELQEGLPSTKEIFLFVHFIASDYRNKECNTKVFMEESEFEFPKFILKAGTEVKANVGCDFNISDFSEVEIKVG